MDEFAFYNSCLTVDLQKIVNNMHSIQRDLGPGVECIPVLKGNAYGLGAVPVARALCAGADVRTIAVAQVGEGAQLRAAGIRRPAILVLGGVPEALFPAAVAHRLQLTVYRPATARLLDAIAAAQGVVAEVQIKVETGLNRTGVKPGAELDALARALAACGHLRTAGVFSHFSTGETKDSPLAHRQFALYEQAVAQLRAAGIDPPQKHMCNSGGSDWFRAAFCNAARIGRRLYMDSQNEPLPPGAPGAVEEVCSWRASVTNLRTVEAGGTVGYDGAWTAPRRTRVATVCVGYGDGLCYPLAQAGGPVLVGERRTRLLATCMDQCFADVTDIPCRVGDEVTFFGASSRGTPLPAQEVSRAVHTEGVYLSSLLTPRVRRVYTGGPAGPGQDKQQGGTDHGEHL